MLTTSDGSLPRAAGVYAITDLTGRRYIGSSVNLRKRYRDHRRSLGANKHHSRFLQRAWNKHGSESFTFAILLRCDRENAVMYEQCAMDAFRPEYNTVPTAGSQLGFRMTAESRAKMSAAAKRTRNFTGKRHTPESRAKISANRKGKGGSGWTQQRRDRIGAAHKGKVVTPEQRAKIAETLRGHKQSPEQIAKRMANMPVGHYEKSAMAKAKLTDDQVRLVRGRLANGESQTSIAASLGVSKGTVSRIYRGLSYAWVSP